LEPLDYGDSSLVGLWTFDEGSGTVAYDYSGSNATGGWSGTQAGTSGYYSAGEVGPWAGTFGGSAASDYVGVPTNNFPTGASSWSLSAWIYYNSTTTFQMIWFYGTDGTAAYVSMNHACPTNDPEVEIWGSGGQTCGSPLTLGTWNHITVTYNGTKFTVYTNGQFSNSNNATLNISNSTLPK